MALTRPALVSPIKPFSSSQSYDFPFIYTSGDQAVKNNLVIQRLSDNVEVYNQTIDSFQLKHPLPPNTLQSGQVYKACIRIANINNQFSEFSDWIIFWVLDNPTITIDNIDYANHNRVYGQTITFSATYTHPNGELLQSYRYLLYDSNQVLIQSFPEVFADGSQPLTQEIAGLQNGEEYYVEVKTLSVNGQEASSGLILFRPFYISPKLLSVLTVENLSDQGAVKVSANIIQIIGKLYDANGNEIDSRTIEYVNGEEIDLTRSDYEKLVFQEGFKIDKSDFVLKLWCKNIPDDKVFLTLRSENGKIELMKYNNKIHTFKYINGFSYPAHFASNELVVNADEQFMVYMKSEGHLIDLSMQLA